MISNEIHPLPESSCIWLERHAPELLETLQRTWIMYCEAVLTEGLSVPQNADFVACLVRVWAYSDFVAELCVREPVLLADLLEQGDLHRDYRAQEYREHLQAVMARVRDEEHLMDVLRHQRKREMLRIAWRDLAGWAGLQETLRDLSLLADACVDTALDRIYTWACRDWGTPYSETGQQQRLVVLGMGKLGAYELNFSSDIDLIFAFPEHGSTRNNKAISNEEFFTRVAQRLIHVIGTGTYQGRVYRVDMRLRPYGESGPLVMCFDAVEDYYQSQGREWERYAMIKARVIGGDLVAGNQLIRMLRPFTYRRYLDFGAFESLREMKIMIAQEVARKGMESNIKLGPGGIREIEFIGQAFQLIRGGREAELQVRGIVPVLKLLARKKYLPVFVTEQLLHAYEFLRRVENRLQALADEQTHTLPDEEPEQKRLALAMGYADWNAFTRALHRHRQHVQEHFEQIFAAPQAEKQTAMDSEWFALWQDSIERAAAVSLLQENGYEDPEYVLGLLRGFHESSAYRARSEQGQARIDHLMPLLLGAIVGAEHQDECLLRIINMLEAIAGRSAYLSLLVENPMALSQLVRLFTISPWIAELLSQHPVLLDELLDPRALYAPLSRVDLNEEMRSLLEQVDADDLEQQMERLRYFKQSGILHVAAADVAGVMPLMVVSDHLTEIAEVVLEKVLDIARGTFVRRHGRPSCLVEGKIDYPGFAIIGYGKLGGIELGYGSDLDLVFLHDSRGEQQFTEGPKVIDNGMFFARLGQRIIHILNAHTPSGILYEVDMRLRPSGASGLLVSDMEAYAHYQREEAWTWEHQALVRARHVAGDQRIAQQFWRIRTEILCKERDPARLQQEVRDMRERMRSELGGKDPERFDLKQGHGGIADIEFLVQYLILRWAYREPDLCMYTDNIRQLQALGDKGILSASEVQRLSDAYRAYRARGHHLVLQDAPAIVPAAEFRPERGAVTAAWERIMTESPD